MHQNDLKISMDISKNTYKFSSEKAYQSLNISLYLVPYTLLDTRCSVYIPQYPIVF
jgi:hypothetical protein